MRRIALLVASLIASAVLILFLVPARASALTAAGLPKGTANGAADGGVHLVRRGGGGGFRSGGYRGGGFRGSAFRGGRAYAFRGGPGWRGRRGWRGPGWGYALGAGALAAAPYYYGGYNCPLVRRTVWTPQGYRVRWVRRC